MIEGKRLKFGYGDISVGAFPVSQRMCFQQIEPPTKCGETIVKDETTELIGERIFIVIDYNNYRELDKLLLQVKSREISEFVFNGYTFDFTNYNEVSVNVIRQKLSQSMMTYFFVMAC